MSSSLRVNTIVPSTGTAIGIGTASGNIDVLGHIVGHNTPNLSGINSVTANTFYGSGANLTGISVDSTKIETGNTKVETIDTGSDGHIKVTTEGTERLRITSGGSVAIGVNSPSDILHVGGNNAFIRVDRPNGNPGLTLIYNSTNSTRADIDVTTGGDLRFATNNSTERLRIDSSGRLGLGVVPEAYHANNKAVIRGDSGYAILGRGDNSLNISQNFYYDSSDAGKYIANGEASVYNQSDGQHVFYSAVSGSANASASLVERLRIRSQGPHLLIGTGGDATYNEITESSSFLLF
jgi:hypothetical protein